MYIVYFLSLSVHTVDPHHHLLLHHKPYDDWCSRVREIACFPFCPDSLSFSSPAILPLAVNPTTPRQIGVIWLWDAMCTYGTGSRASPLPFYYVAASSRFNGTCIYPLLTRFSASCDIHHGKQITINHQVTPTC